MKIQSIVVQCISKLMIFLIVTGLWACADTDNNHSHNNIAPQDDARGYIYVTLAKDGQVAVIDEAAEEVVKTIDVGAGPAIIIATPDNSKVYTANWGDNTISAIDTTTDDVATVSVVSRPFIIAMSPDGRYVYAGLYANQIDVIDTATDTVEKSFTTDIFPASLFVSPDGGTLYVATTAATPGKIWAVSTQTGEIVHDAIEVGDAPGWITMMPNGDKVFALNYYSDDVSVVDTANWAINETVFTGEGSGGVIGNVTPDNTTLYITNLGTADLIAIDTQSYEIFQSIPLGGRPSGVHFNEDASHIYVTHYGPQSLENLPNSDFLITGVWNGTNPGFVNAILADTGEIISSIEVGPGPTSVVWIAHD